MTTKQKTRDPFIVPVTFCVQIDDDKPEEVRRIRREVCKLLGKAPKRLRVYLDTRLGRGGVYLAEPFQQKARD
jgi:hypothetical protein